MNCPICSYRNFWKIPAARNSDAEQLLSANADSRKYKWRLCQQCGNAYPSHPPELRILEKLWALDRADINSSEREKAEKWTYRRAIARAGAERSYRLFAPLTGKNAGRFVDIACGLGETVRIFAAHGWDAEGFDADASTEASHREIGIRARIGQFEQLNVGAGYDIVHIAHAIYFITDPMHFMRTVHERMSPRGIFCVVIADFLASSDLSLPSYIHTFFPTGSSMRYALACAGFETVLCKHLSGSIFIAARPVIAATRPNIWPTGIWLLYRTKTIRYAVVGRGYILLRKVIKRFIGRR